MSQPGQETMAPSGAWRAGMVLSEDLREDRRTLLKIERRVYSPDYVPAAVFAGMK